MENYVWLKTMKYFKVLHPKKSWRWRFKQYFKADYTGVSKDKWILTNPNNNSNQSLVGEESLKINQLYQIYWAEKKNITIWKCYIQVVMGNIIVC